MFEMANIEGQTTVPSWFAGVASRGFEDSFTHVQGYEDMTRILSLHVLCV